MREASSQPPPRRRLPRLDVFLIACCRSTRTNGGFHESWMSPHQFASDNKENDREDDSIRSSRAVGSCSRCRSGERQAPILRSRFRTRPPTNDERALLCVTKNSFPNERSSSDVLSVLPFFPSGQHNSRTSSPLSVRPWASRFLRETPISFPASTLSSLHMLGAGTARAGGKS
jgi:hypothetical protein